jgi:hypothetical protein
MRPVAALIGSEFDPQLGKERRVFAVRGFDRHVRRWFGHGY